MIVIKSTVISDECEDTVKEMYKVLMRIKNREKPVRLDDNARKHVRGDMYLTDMTKTIRDGKHVIDVVISDLKGSD